MEIRYYDALKKKIIEAKKEYKDDEIGERTYKQGILQGYVEAYYDLGIIRDKDYRELDELI